MVMIANVNLRKIFDSVGLNGKCVRITIEVIFSICQTVGDIWKCQSMVTFGSVNLIITMYMLG